MVKIITDTSALYTVEEGKRLGIHVIPLCVSINDQHYRDLCFDAERFYQDVCAGAIPTTSQPPIGDVLAAYEACKGEEILNLCMADGLSGTYQTACMAKEQAENAADITVWNTQTLCGPHRYLVQKAIQLRDMGKNVKEIVAELEICRASEHSFLIPQDFSFLKRGGRLKPAAASIGGLLKLKPIMEKVEEGRRLDKFALTRTMGKAVDSVIAFAKEHGASAQDRFYVAHAHALQDAQMIIAQLKKAFGEIEIELLELSPAFLTQGGPRCVAIQYISQ